MPDMDGVSFLNAARQLHPEARRVLLTAYADTDAAIKAINDVQLHHYLMKPWDPPEQHLFPVLKLMTLNNGAQVSAHAVLIATGLA